MVTAEELHRRGVVALNRGRHADARRLLEGAAAAATDADLRARVEASLAYVLSETGDSAGAVELCRVALARAGTALETQALLHSQLGLLLMLRGDGEEALAAFERSLVSRDPLALANTHLNRGNVYLQRSQPALATQDFETAERQFALAGDSFGAAKAVHNLGYARLLDGDLPGALSDMDRAYPTFAAEGPVMTAMADQDRAEALIAAGLVDEGVEALRAAGAAYARRRLPQRQGEAELARARYAATPVEARAAARKAVDRFERSGAPSWRARAEAEALAADVALGRVADVAARGDALADELAAHRLRWNAVGVRLQVARGLLAAGQGELARTRLRAVRTSPAAPLAVRLTERDVRAEAAVRRTDALAHVRAGLAELEAWQSSFGSLDLQTNVVGHGTRLAVRGLALAVGSPSDAVLFEWSERARMLASRIQPVRTPRDPEAVADLAELREGPVPEREAELRRRIRERAWQARGSGEVSEPLSLSGFRGSLPEDTSLVAYVVTADRIVALVVARSGVRRVDLGPRAALEPLLGGLLPDLDMAAADLPAPMAGFVRGALTARLAQVDELLVAPLAAHLGERVVLTPSGVLAGVPWSLLPGLVGRPVTVAQSATSWLARRRTPLRTGSAGFVAGPRVARAEDEVRAAALAWPRARVLAGADATAGAAAEVAGSVDVLHVAAHGRHAAENPLFSGLELADGTWFGYDIDQLADVPDVVLLSACEVGRSSVRLGEELIGMTAAWLHAGARAVLASPAAVNDATAHDVLVAVHRSLAAGADPAAALAGAAGRAEEAPAPFVVFG